MSKRRADQRGLLTGPGHTNLTRCILGGMDDERPEKEKGGIRALRKHIAKAKQLLRERIAP